MTPYRCSEAEVTRGVHHSEYSHTPMAAESGTDPTESGAPADNLAFSASLFATWGATKNFLLVRICSQGADIHLTQF